VFVKAIPADHALAADYLAEARCAAALPDRVPAGRLRFCAPAAGWVLLCFTDLPGRHPDLTVPAELGAVLATVRRLAEVLTPNPVPGLPAAGEALDPVLRGWRSFAAQGPPPDLDGWSARHLPALAELEAGWAAAAAGGTLLHADLRPDNMVLTDAGAVAVVDWAGACVGAAWVDLVLLLCSVGGVDAEAIVRGHPVTRGVDPAAIDAVVCAVAGCWERESRQPPVPDSPYLRRFQARNAVLTRAWLAARTGWR
jgi:Ser/Thr protein kinase RdoA (MazF antagonist)